MLLKNWYKSLCGRMSGANGLPVKIRDVNNAERDFGMGPGSGYGTDPAYNILNNISTSKTCQGVVFGDGDAPAALDDYWLSGNQITTITATITDLSTGDENGVSIKRVFTITNTGSTEITIKEVGWLANCFYSKSSSAYYYALFERTVLDTPVTIPGGGIGQVTYQINGTAPTA